MGGRRITREAVVSGSLFAVRSLLLQLAIRQSLASDECEKTSHAGVGKIISRGEESRPVKVRGKAPTLSLFILPVVAGGGGTALALLSRTKQFIVPESV